MTAGSQITLTLGHWVGAFRLRTLPLALASITLGSFLAAFEGKFRLEVFVLSALTTIFLQILSNLANDYGDFVHGVDNTSRQGPQRAVQRGVISAQVMKRALYLFAFLSFISGIYLLYISFGFNRDVFATFLILGILAIVAAISYTAGTRPYGYLGLGDLSVMIFFGFVGVLGTLYLHAETFNPEYLLPAAACGFFSVGVLNINNIRDIESDKLAGKRSIPVRIGRKRAVIYHVGLLVLGWACATIFMVLQYSSILQFGFLLTLPLFVSNARAVLVIKETSKLDPYLKQMALSTLLFVVLFGIGLVI